MRIRAIRRYSLASQKEKTVCVTTIYPLLRQWIGFDKLASALQTAGESQSFPPYNIEKATITTTASPLRWPVSVRKIWIFSWKAPARW